MVGLLDGPEANTTTRAAGWDHVSLIRRLSFIALAATIMTFVPDSVRAQSAQARISDNVAIDSLLALVPARTDEAYEAEMRQAVLAENEGADRKVRAERSRSVVRAEREVQEAEIERLKKEADIADDLDQSARKADLEAEKKLRERYREYLGDRAQSLEREAKVGEAQASHARATRKRIEAERELARDWRELRGLLYNDSVGVSSSASRRIGLEESIHENLKKYYEAVRDEAREAQRLAERKREYAEKLIDVVERRVKLFED